MKNTKTAKLNIKQFVLMLSVSVVSCVLVSAYADTVIVHDTFSYTGEETAVADRAPDVVNLPGSNWVSVVQWDWSYPFINGDERSWAWPQNAADMGEEKCSINISLAEYNTGILRISADVAMPSERLGSEGIALGFKGVVPYIGWTNVNYETEIKSGFNGIAVNGDGVIFLIENGETKNTYDSGRGLTGYTFYPMSYDVDTASGDVFNIKFNNEYMGDFATTAFTEVNTSNAVFLVLAGSRGQVDNFKVTAIEGLSQPSVSNASGATGIAGSSATLNGILTGGTTADAYIFWGTDPENWANTNMVGTLYEGMFSLNITDLPISTEHFYQCYATNDVGEAWAGDVSSFVSAAQIFTWTGAGGNSFWNDVENWDPDIRVPNLPRETVRFIDGSDTVYLNQPAVTVGGITMYPNEWSDLGFNITTNAPEQKLILDYPDGPGFIRVLGNRWTSGTISAPMIVNNDIDVTIETLGENYGLLLRGPVSGEGSINVKKGIVFLDPLEDTVYNISFHGANKNCYISKRGKKTATLTGTSSISLAGGWGDVSCAVRDGSKLILSGGEFTNLTRSERGVFFRDSGNEFIVADGCKLVNANNNNQAIYHAPGNTITITGEGTEWDLNLDHIIMNAPSNRLTVADGARLVNARGRIGWWETGNSYNEVLVTGDSTVWDVGESISVGQNSSFNTVTISNNAVVQNTWIWLGAYAYWESGYGSDNGLIVTDGGKFYSGRDDGWNWGSCIGAGGSSEGRNDRNYALITGTDSLWDLGSRPLRIGFMMEENSTGAWNRVRAEAGGMITNIGHAYIGWTENNAVTSSNELIAAVGGSISASGINVGTDTSIGNRIILEGGTINTGSLLIEPGNKLTPVLSKDELIPLKVSGTAVFEDGSYISPEKADDYTSAGNHVVLVADSIEDNGLMLDPDLDASNWFIEITSTQIMIRYSEYATTIIVR